MTTPRADTRRSLVVELVIVALITFGTSAISAVLNLVASLQRGRLSEQTVALNPSRAEVGWLDLAAQITSAARLFAWGALGIYLLWRSGFTLRAIGLRRPGGVDALTGAALAALIGLPGLGLYLLAHRLGFSVTVAATTIDDVWWRVPVLVLWAFANAFAEELLVVGYAMTRLRQLGAGRWGATLASATLRGAYHLYQGFGAGLGNLVMGLIFGAYWQRRHRLWPLVFAHALIDTVAFVGYAWARGRFAWLP